MRGWRTQTRPNGHPQVREHVWGWDVILPRIVTVIAILGLAVQVGEYKSDLQQIKKAQEKAAEELPGQIASELAKNALIAPGVSRVEWAADKAEIARQLAVMNAEQMRLLRSLVAGDMYNRRVLSNIERTQPPGKDDK